MKTCSTCGEDKPLDDFYTGSAKCKPCYCAAVRANREANIDRYRAADRARSDEPHRVALRKAVRERRRADPDASAIDLKSKERWRKKSFVKSRAHIIAGNAIRDGILRRPYCCERCGDVGALEGHHEDYYKPLTVTWLCEPCHGARHREINAMLRDGVDLTCRGFQARPPAGGSILGLARDGCVTALLLAVDAQEAAA